MEKKERKRKGKTKKKKQKKKKQNKKQDKKREEGECYALLSFINTCFFSTKLVPWSIKIIIRWSKCESDW